MHLNQCFFKVFEPNVSFSGTAGGPSGRDRGFADAANEKSLEFQRFSRVAIVIPLVPHLGGGSPVWWTIHQRCEKPGFSKDVQRSGLMLPFRGRTFPSALRKDRVLQRFQHVSRYVQTQVRIY